MKKISLAMFGMVLALVCAQSASAQTYDFTFTGVNSVNSGNCGCVGDTYVGDTGSGSFVVSGNQVVSLSGTFDGEAMTLDTSGFANNPPAPNNQFYPGGVPSEFDLSGLDFDANGIIYNIFGDNGANVAVGTFIQGNDTGSGSGPVTPLDISVTYVPEGGGLSMLVLCGLGLAGAFLFKARNGLLMNR